MQRPLYQGCWPSEGEDRRTGEAGRQGQWETHLGGQVGEASLFEVEKKKIFAPYKNDLLKLLKVVDKNV
jgi:hypothetical protein